MSRGKEMYYVILCFQKKKVSSNSFEPVPIVEAEEKERVALMAQRDFLVRSFRVVDQVGYFLF